MATPSPVNVEGPSLGFGPEQNNTSYLRGSLNVFSAYDDAVFSSTFTPVSDVSYSVRPSIAIDKSGARLHWNLFYSPGFTFYQRYSSLNQSDHDLVTDLSYRLSPHVTLTFMESLTKSSSAWPQFDPNKIGSVTGILQSPNQSIIEPIADKLFNSTAGQITYQYSENGMIGASGIETEQRYLQLSQVPGLFNSSLRGATAFYARRLSRKHYIGAIYQFQQLLSHPNGAENQSDGAFLFYTLYATPAVSLSFFGGPQYNSSPEIRTKQWTPAGGVALAWQGLRTNVSLSFARRVRDGGGLLSGVLSSSADASIRHLLSKTLTVSVVGAYATNSDPSLRGNAGHTLSGSAFLQRALGEHLTVQLAYARAHQSYLNIPALSSFPDRNRAWVSFSYNVQRPLGR
jgi:hypothetical protein